MRLGFLVVGTRPNFMKAAALYEPLSKYFDIKLVHTGQHYDENMSRIFFNKFNQLDISYKFNLTKKGHAKQTAEIMEKFDILCDEKHPDFVIVVGDVNSTLACGLVAKKRGIKLIHVEAGIRSFDKTMPEEINRILVDHISDFLFATEPAAMNNLVDEGLSNKLNTKVYLVGDVMIDTLEKHISDLVAVKEDYCICTIHREKNVIDSRILKNLLWSINRIAESTKVIFPIHPNTKNLIKSYGYDDMLYNIDVRNPMAYIDFLSYVKHAKFVVTDSGSLQTECNYMNIPCLVLRENTERRTAVDRGCCELVGFDLGKLLKSVDIIIKGKWKDNFVLNIDDGKAAKRIADILDRRLNERDKSKR